MYERLRAPSRGGIPLQLGARELHAVTVHFFSRQITELSNNEIKC